MIRIIVDTSELDRTLADFPARLAAAQRRSLEAIGAEVAGRAGRASRTESLRPSPWAPRKRDYPHPVLQKSGNMKKGIGWRLDGADTVVVGTPAEYARYHQEGTKNMPARPFFPVERDGSLTPAMARKVARTVERIYAETLNG